MKKERHVSQTPATVWLRQHGVPYTGHAYDYQPHGGALQGAAALELSAHAVIKTLVMQDEHARPLIVLIHGDRKVSTRQLARQIGVKTVQPCEPAVAERHSGYQVGGTSPFGTRRAMPVYVEQSILELPQIAINGGRRGFIVQINPQACVQALGARPVHCAISLDE